MATGTYVVPEIVNIDINETTPSYELSQNTKIAIGFSVIFAIAFLIGCILLICCCISLAKLSGFTSFGGVRLNL